MLISDNMYINFGLLFYDDDIKFLIKNMCEENYDYVVVLIVIYLELWESFKKFDVIYCKIK